MKHLMLAKCRIKRNPSGRMRHNGKFDDYGRPVMRSASEFIMPETMFEMDDQDPDFALFLELEAIEYVDDPGTKALWKKNHARATDLDGLGDILG